MQAQHQTLYAFQGNSFRCQLTFCAGEAIVLLNVQNDWAYGRLVSNNESGWFPTSYIQPIQAKAATMVNNIPYAYATPVHSYNTNNMAAYPTTSPFDVPTGKGALMTTQHAHVAYYDDDTGFTGPIMGGSAPTTSTAWDQRNDSNGTSDTHNNKSWIQKAGTNISTVAQKAGSSASAAASKTTSKISSAATSTGSFLSRGLKNSSLGQTQPQQQVYTVQTNTEYGGRSSKTPRGGDSSTTRTVVTTQGGRSGRERVAGSVGTYATYAMAMNAMSGNVVGVIRSGTVAAGAFAIEGNAAEKRNHQSSNREK